MQTTEFRERISLPVAAKELGIPWATAWNAVLRGSLEGVKEGRVWMVTRSSVEQYRRLRAPEPAPAA